MAQIQKPVVMDYEYADAETQAVMKPLIRALEEQRYSVDAMTSYGREAEQQFKQSVAAIESFLNDPSSPEADQQTKDRLRDQFIAAAQNMALTMGVGQEVARRYESEYLEAAAEMLMITEDPEQKEIKELIACRDALDTRLDVLRQPEQSHDYVCAAIGKIESGRQLSISVSRGLPLEEAISVRKAPLRLLRP